MNVKDYGGFLPGSDEAVLFDGVYVSKYGVKDCEVVFPFKNVLDMQISKRCLKIFMKTSPTSDHPHYEYPVPGVGQVIFDTYFENLGRI